jgi:hypothetical protein
MAHQIAEALHVQFFSWPSNPVLQTLRGLLLIGDGSPILTFEDYLYDAEVGRHTLALCHVSTSTKTK